MYVCPRSCYAPFAFCCVLVAHKAIGMAGLQRGKYVVPVLYYGRKHAGCHEKAQSDAHGMLLLLSCVPLVAGGRRNPCLVHGHR